MEILRSSPDGNVLWKYGENTHFLSDEQFFSSLSDGSSAWRSRKMVAQSESEIVVFRTIVAKMSLIAQHFAISEKNSG